MSKKHMMLVDVQVLQSEARDRGMGRYTIGLIKELIDSHRYDRVELLLNKNMPIDEGLYQIIEQSFSGADCVRLSLKTTERSSIESAEAHNRTQVDNYLKVRTSEEVDFFIPCPFQEPTVTTFPTSTRNILLFYDLIPYLYHHQYKPVMLYENYLKRFRLLMQADGIATISKGVADDLHVFLGIPKEKIFCIDGAPIRTDHHAKKPEHFDVPEKYVLMPSSDDPRKNNLRAVIAFEEFKSAQSGCDYKLVITSKIHHREREHLAMFSDNLVFTGNLCDAELNWLYKNTDIVFFVPESEGLGLPVLEGVEAGKKVVCSSINVFKEISEDAFCYCDYEDTRSIASALIKAADGSYVIDNDEYARIMNYYNWRETAKRFIKGSDKVIKKKGSDRKLKIAIFTPTPDGLSAVGKVVAESHPVLSKYCTVHYYVEQGLYADPVRPNYLQYIAEGCFPAEEFSVKRYGEYDAVIYHIGNGDYHIRSVLNALYLPGYVVLHDTNIREAYRVLSDQRLIAKQRFKLEEDITKKIGSEASSFLATLVNRQLGVITHSEYAKHATNDILHQDGIRVKRVDLALSAPALPNYSKSNRPVIGLAGIIADIKGIGVIEAIASNPCFRDCRLKIFGFSHATQETLDRLNSYENLEVTTNLTDFNFQKNISQLDVFVNFRTKYQGETSLSTLEAMRQGVVVVVRDFGWYSELPDKTVIKVSERDEIIPVLQELLGDPAKKQVIASAAKQYVQKYHTHELYTQALLDIIATKGVGGNWEISEKLKSDRIRSVHAYLAEIKVSKIGE